MLNLLSVSYECCEFVTCTYIWPRPTCPIRNSCDDTFMVLNANVLYVLFCVSDAEQ